MVRNFDRSRIVSNKRRCGCKCRARSPGPTVSATRARTGTRSGHGGTQSLPPRPPGRDRKLTVCLHSGRPTVLGQEFRERCQLPIHKAQLLSYMKLLKKPLGLLVNFHELILRTEFAG